MHAWKMAMRRLGRHRAFTAINVAGLAAGLVCVLFIQLFIQDEHAYDRLHTKADRIFRVVADVEMGTGVRDLAVVPAPWGPTLAAEEAAVETFVRFATFAAPVLVRHGERAAYENHFFWADSTVFAVFDFRLRRGNPATALTAPNSLVLTARSARTYFGDADPIGQTVTVDEKRDYTVTGVLEPLPDNLHFRFDFLASFTTLEDMYAEERGRFGWGHHFYYTYLLLADPAAAPRLAEGIPAFVGQHASERIARVYAGAALEPLHDIYLRSHRSNDVGPRGDVAYVRLLAALGAFILALACINFTNLSTAQSAGRVREVGVRKALGASRPGLVRHLLGESLLVALAAAAVAALLAVPLLPLFNAVSGKTLGFGRLLDVELALGLLGAALVAGLAGGLYPALVLSRPAPATVLKGSAFTPRGGVRFRQALVVFQFAVTVFLIGATAVVYSQIRYVLNKPLGFSEERVVIVPMYDLTLRERYPILKEAFLAHPNVRSVSASSTVPGARAERYPYRPEGYGEDETLVLPMVSADPDFVEALGLTVAEGRALSEAFAGDAEQGFLINRALADRLGWQEAVGRRIAWVRSRRDVVEGEVVGVVEDFHTTSLREAIEPAVLHVVPERFNFFSLRLGPGDLAETLGFLERAWAEHEPGWPFQYRFLDDDLAALYETEQRVGRLATTFAVLALFVACLGLFGLVAFETQRRAKEIGIRKALGATTSEIIALLTKNFLRLVLVAAVVAAPLAYLAMQRWLADFAYHIALPRYAWVFAAAGLVALVLALATVSLRALRAAHTDPAEVLRYE